MAQSEAGEVAVARLAAPAVLIGGAFFFIAWDACAVGAPLFMAALAVAVVGYIWMLQLRWLEIPVASGPRLGGRSKISGSVVGSARAAYRMVEIIAWLWWTARRRLTPA